MPERHLGLYLESPGHAEHLKRLRYTKESAKENPKRYCDAVQTDPGPVRQIGLSHSPNTIVAHRLYILRNPSHPWRKRIDSFLAELGERLDHCVIWTDRPPLLAHSWVGDGSYDSWWRIIDVPHYVGEAVDNTTLDTLKGMLAKNFEPLYKHVPNDGRYTYRMPKHTQHNVDDFAIVRATVQPQAHRHDMDSLVGLIDDWLIELEDMTAQTENESEVYGRWDLTSNGEAVLAFEIIFINWNSNERVKIKERISGSANAKLPPPLLWVWKVRLNASDAQDENIEPERKRSGWPRRPTGRPDAKKSLEATLFIRTKHGNDGVSKGLGREVR